MLVQKLVTESTGTAPTERGDPWRRRSNHRERRHPDPEEPVGVVQ
jgi:hypothetical protein